MKHAARKRVAIDSQVEQPEPKDDQPLIQRQNRLSNMTQPSANRVPANAATSSRAHQLQPLLSQLCERTIIEEKLLSVEGLEGKYTDVLQTLQFHEFEQFIRPRGPYIPSWVREFYTAYGALVCENKKQASEFIPVRYVTVQGTEVEGYSEHINVVIGRPLHSVHPYEGFPPAASLDELKEWLAPMIYEDTERWIGVGAPIEKWDLNIATRFWRTIALGMLTSQEMAMRAKQTRTSLTFRILITELCHRAGVPRDPTRDIEVTPTSATDIRHFEAKYMREEADMRRPAPADTSQRLILT
uniref:Putative plant transposon protein domain-containing protein n=1 Tax=Solanum tuberosum TaxID=4113 RepID=M1DCI4_SOLTU